MTFAHDIMNPIWVFEMGVSLTYDFVDSAGNIVKVVQKGRRCRVAVVGCDCPRSYRPTWIACTPISFPNSA